MKKIFAILLSVNFLFSQNVLTLYNNLAFVKETMENGLCHQVPSDIVFDSIFFDTKSKVLEVKYEYTPLNIENILKGYVGKDIFFKYKNKKLKGILVSLNPLIIKTDKRVYFDVSYKNLIIKNIPEKIKSKPTVCVKKSGKKDKIYINYLTKNISWRSSYVAKLDRYLNIIGWVKIENRSDKDFKNVNLNVVAGDIKTITSAPIRYKTLAYEAASKPKSFEGYYLYRLNGKYNIEKNSKKIIPFINEDNIEYKKEYICNVFDSRYNFGSKEYKFRQKISFKINSPLPAGKIRFYKDDVFLGENFITNVPKNKKIEIEIGKDFDLWMKREQISFKKDKFFIYTAIKSTIYNPKNVDVEVIVNDNFNNTQAKIDIKCKDCSYKKIDSNRLRYIIKLPKKSKIEILSKYKIKYKNY